MKSARPVLLAVALVGVFYYITTHRHVPFDTPFAQQEVVRSSDVAYTQSTTPVTYDAEEQNNIALYKKVLPSVVNITSTAVAFDFFYGAVPQEGQGSGFLIDKQGHVLTNYHVVANARQVEVTMSNRRKYKAQIVGLDPAHDLAVIKITAPTLVPAVMGDSKSLVVGQKVYAIGNPFGLNGTMTRGIISSIRSIRGSDNTPIDDAIQTDAAINPGNSGGPLLNSRGEVVGINTMIATGGANQSAGVGFAVPINAAKAVLDELIKEGRVRRPSFGIRGAFPVTPELAQELGLPAEYGVLIMQVVPGGAADRAGLRGGSERAYLGNTPIMLGGDLIVAIDGQEIMEPADIAGLLNNRRSGDTIKVTVYRGKRKMEIPVKLGGTRETAA